MRFLLHVLFCFAHVHGFEDDGVPSLDEEWIHKCEVSMENSWRDLATEEVLRCIEVLMPLQEKRAAEQEIRVQNAKKSVEKDVAERKVSDDFSEQQKLVEEHKQLAIEAQFGLENCEKSLQYLQKQEIEQEIELGKCLNPDECLLIDARIAPLFGWFGLPVEALVILFFIFGILCWFASATRASFQPAPYLMCGVGQIRVSNVHVEDGGERIDITNRSQADMDMSGCKVCVGQSATFEFNDGYNLARGTTASIHSGESARRVKEIDMPDHDKFDSRRCDQLYWTSSSVVANHDMGGLEVKLLDATGGIVSTF